MCTASALLLTFEQCLRYSFWIAHTRIMRHLLDDVKNQTQIEVVLKTKHRQKSAKHPIKLKQNQPAENIYLVSISLILFSFRFVHRFESTLEIIRLSQFDMANIVVEPQPNTACESARLLFTRTHTRQQRT